jgi:hypothetical protein
MIGQEPRASKPVTDLSHESLGFEERNRKKDPTLLAALAGIGENLNSHVVA